MRPAQRLDDLKRYPDDRQQNSADCSNINDMPSADDNEFAVAIRIKGEKLACAESKLSSSPRFLVVVEGKCRNLRPSLDREVYRVATEALRNAFRHAEARNVEVEIRYAKKYFRLRVRDDGRGISPQAVHAYEGEGQYGLIGMKESAALMRGALAIWSEVGAGTEIELVVPASTAYKICTGQP